MGMKGFDRATSNLMDNSGGDDCKSSKNYKRKRKSVHARSLRARAGQVCLATENPMGSSEPIYFGNQIFDLFLEICLNMYSFYKTYRRSNETY